MYENENPIAELVHLYLDGAFNRRELIRRVARKTGSVAAAMTALAVYPEVQAAEPAEVPPGVRTAEGDPEFEAMDVSFPGEGGTVYGYLAIPKTAQQELQPAVIVVHENRGLVEHIKDVTRRVAKAGFVGLAVDLLSRQGGTSQFAEPTQQTAAYNRTNQFERRADLLAGLDFLKYRDYVVFDRIGIVGFCAGGGNAWDFAVNFPEAGAAVPFYGAPPTLEEVERVRVPVLAIYAERDRTLTNRLFPVAQAMITQQKTFGMIVYEGAGHAFHNDTGAAYNAAAARDAWAQTIGFFNKWLRRPR
jgi:carboxymethylenebutenolidase